MSKQGSNAAVTHEQIIGLLGRVRQAGYDFIKMESLCNFDGQPGYSLGQGQ
jgi:isocitrate dehydrogenase